ncbi:MAG: hypothetical protein II559_00120 [Muribaculaceae bacterium]|nr:hypothetical protein [Muribaculaceae bacterium]
MRKKIIIVTMATLAALAVAFVAYMRNNDCVVPERTIIAHAGGSIDSLTYSNSREAVMNAIAQGVKYIELDIVISPEGEPLAFHSSPDMIDTLYSCDPPHMGEFKAAPLRGKNGKLYTPLTWREINEIFLSHPDLTFVVDKTDDPAILKKFFPRLKNRMVVECFSLERYAQVKKAGFRQAMLSENSVGRTTIVWQGIKHIFCPGEPKVEMIAMSRDTYDHQRLNRWLIKIFNIPVAMWTAVDLENAQKIFNNAPQVRMIYTNELSPQ